MVTEAVSLLVQMLSYCDCVPLVCVMILLSGRGVMSFPDHITMTTTEELPVPSGRLSCVQSINGYHVIIRVM